MYKLPLLLVFLKCFVQEQFDLCHYPHLCKKYDPFYTQEQEGKLIFFTFFLLQY